MTPIPRFRNTRWKNPEWIKASGSALKFSSSGLTAPHSLQLPLTAWHSS